MTRRREAPARVDGRAALALAGIVLAFVVVATWNIGDAGFSGFYGSAARSMSVSWRAFWFGAFDPGASITIDKLTGFLVPQALSARLFGFHAWSLALPQVVEGAITIVVVYLIGSRWRGSGTGLLAAGFFALTPLMVSMFGHTMEDGLLTMSLALAFASLQKAVVTAGLPPVIVAGIWVGVGFQAKMLQAWFVLPAFVVAILVVQGLPLAARIGRALLFLGVSLVASLSWMSLATAFPTDDRPYFDGSVDDNVFSAVFGYNGLNRFVPGSIPGAAPNFTPSVITGSSDGASPFKLLLPAFTTQIGWFFPLAVAGVVFAIHRLRRVRREGRDSEGPGSRPPETTALVLGLGGWLLTSVVVLSVSSVPHTAYLAALVVQLAVFAALGVQDTVALLRRGRRGPALAVVAASTAWATWILASSRVAPPWSVAVVLASGVVAVIALGTGRRVARRTAGVLAAIGILLGPVLWTGSTLDPALAGTANDAYAGPRTNSVPFFFQTQAPASERTSFRHFAIRAPVYDGQDPLLTREQQDLVDFVSRGDPTGPLFLTSSWEDAEPYILAGGLDVRAVGGFSGAVPSPTLEAVRRNPPRYVLLPARAAPKATATEAERIVRWVTATCELVPDAVYEASTSLPGQSLWDCHAG